MYMKFVRTDQTIYLLDDNDTVIEKWTCSDDFEEGYNEYGEPRASLPNGTYPNCSAEITNGKYGPAYGTFYIETNDYRSRCIHGGGSSCEDPYAPYQDYLYPTYGCLRMFNHDGEILSQLIINNGNDILLEVID